ncbi:hypothetical protein WICPIJ_008930, partial [Wickerhamomyces pijperi]
WISSLPRNIGCPPKYTAAPSDETLVLVDLLENIRVTSLPFKASLISEPTGSPDLISFLWYAARATSEANSDVLRSEMDTKCFKPLDIFEYDRCTTLNIDML